MKKVLSLLLAFVFLQVQTWALSGGPQYGGNQAALSGTYAGVLTGISNSTPLGEVVGANTANNSLGIFVIGVPTVDAAQGSMAIFTQGVFYQGGLLAVADPNDQKLSAVGQAIHVAAVSQSTGNNGTSTSIAYDARCDGTLTAKFESGGPATGLTLKGKGNFTVASLVTEFQTVTDPETGDTTIVEVPTFPEAGNLQFKVRGFQQSTTVVIPNAGSTAALLNGTGAAAGSAGQ